MSFLTIIKIALQNLKVNKIRSLFTMVGVIIGIATVLVILSVGEGLKGYIVNQVQSFGSNTLFVEARPPENTISPTVITTLKVSQMEYILESPAFEYITQGYAYLGGQGIGISPYNQITVDLMGTNQDFIDIDSAEVAYGRFFTDREERSLRKVAVLGFEAAEKLFPNRNPVGQKLKVNQLNLEIVGVLVEKGPDFSLNMDKMVILPLKLMRSSLDGVDYIPYFALRVNDESQLESSKAQVEAYLRKAHNIKEEEKDDFAVMTSDEAIELVGGVLVGVQLLLFSLALISLIVGGVGIMNIMYVSVTERIREIGLRKAIGAKSKDIRNQFLMEAIIVTLLGGICGVIIGIVITYFVIFFAKSYGFDWDYFISWQAVVVSFSVAMLFGVVFGLAPARKASQQDPITALRFE